MPNTDIQPGAEGPRAEMEVALRGVSVEDKRSLWNAVSFFNGVWGRAPPARSHSRGSLILGTK